MCSEYESRTSKRELEEALSRRLNNATDESSWDLHVKMTMKAPIIELVDGKPTLTKRVFPVHPFPNSRLSGVDLEKAGDLDSPDFRRIYELPTWKTGFRSERCLAVATKFLEPAYWGPHAGSVVGFQIPKQKVFFIAAIGIKPNKPPTGKRDGFSLLTHVASQQMLKHHHRLVVALEPKLALGYLEFPEDTPPIEIFQYLMEHRFTGKLEETVARKMAKGWESRIDTQKDKLTREQRYIDALKDEGIAG